MPKIHRFSGEFFVVNGYHIFSHRRPPQQPKQVVSANWRRSEDDARLVVVTRDFSDGSQESNTATPQDLVNSIFNGLKFLRTLADEGKDHLKPLAIAIVLIGAGLLCWHHCNKPAHHEVAHVHAAVM